MIIKEHIASDILRRYIFCTVIDFIVGSCACCDFSALIWHQNSKFSFLCTVMHVFCTRVL